MAHGGGLTNCWPPRVFVGEVLIKIAHTTYRKVESVGYPKH